jgi:hypothetical protein
MRQVYHKTALNLYRKYPTPQHLKSDIAYSKFGIPGVSGYSRAATRTAQLYLHILQNVKVATALQLRAMPLRSAPKAQRLAAALGLLLAAAKREKAWSR